MSRLSPEYVKYISSRQWRVRKSAYYQVHERKCTACGIRARIQLHHLSYENLFNEPDSDLMPLCAIHHEMVDQFQSSGASLRRATEHMLAWVKEHPGSDAVTVRIGQAKGRPRRKRRKNPTAKSKVIGSREPSKRTPPPAFIPRNQRPGVSRQDPLDAMGWGERSVDNGTTDPTKEES